MTLAVKNSLIIVKSGALATSCTCCKKRGCGAIAGSGGPGTTIDTYDVGDNEFTVILYYDAFSVPDQFIVRAGGQVYIDTGSISGGGERRFCKPEGIDQIEVEVRGPEGTAWVYSLGCPQTTEANNVTDATLEIKCATEDVTGDYNNAIVYFNVCFNYPSETGGCSNAGLRYEFQLCTYSEAGVCVGSSLAGFASIDASSRLVSEPGFAASKDEIALFGHTDGARSCVWLGKFDAIQNVSYGIRIVTVNPETGERSSGVLLGPHDPASLDLCEYYNSLPDGGFSATVASVTNLGGNVFSYRGTFSFPAGLADCPQYVQVFASSYKSWSNNNFNPTPAAQGWGVITDASGVLTLNNAVSWDYRCIGPIVPDATTGQAIVFAIDLNPCDSRAVKPYFVLAIKGLP